MVRAKGGTVDVIFGHGTVHVRPCMPFHKGGAARTKKARVDIAIENFYPIV